MDYTTTALLSKLKNWAAIPDSQPAFTDATLLEYMTDEMYCNIVPFIMDFNEEFFVNQADQSITTDATGYQIPNRAMGAKLREVHLVNTAGDTQDVPRVTLEHIMNESYGFYLNGNKVVLAENNSYTNDSVRLYYYRRPNELVAEASAAAITAFDATTVTAASIPSAIASGTTEVDIIAGTPPFVARGDGLSQTHDGAIMTLTVPADTAIGDFICTKQQSPVAQIPWELTQLLVQATVIRVMSIIGSSDDIKRAVAKFKDMKNSVTNMLSPRVDGEIKKIKNWNSFV